MARARYRRRNLAARAQARATAPARRPAGSAPERHSQAAAAAEADEALAVLPINRQVFTRVLVLTGNARRAVREAGYRCKSPKVETAMAREILATSPVQRALEALRRLRGLDAGALDEFLAVPLSGYTSPDSGDRDRSLKAIGFGLKYLAPPRPSAAEKKSATDDILSEMSAAELEDFATHRRWPERFRSRLCAAGYTPSRDGATGAGTPNGTGSSCAREPSGSGAAPAASPSTVSDSSSDDRAGDGERATSATTRAAPPPPEPSPMPAPFQPTRLSESLEPAAPRAWQRPEERVYVTPRPPSAQPTPEEQATPEAERRRCALLHARLSRDVPSGW